MYDKISPMYIIVDNTKNLAKTYMTPMLINVVNKFFVQCRVLSEWDEVDEVICNSDQYRIEGIILSGGPLCLSKDSISKRNKNIRILKHFKDVPILGICFGFQVMSYYYGGKIKSMSREKNGISRIKVLDSGSRSKLFGQDRSIVVIQSHKDNVVTCPKGFIVTSVDPNDGVIQSIESYKLKRYGVQFHPEGLQHSEGIIKNFIKICKQSHT